jgi:sugar lactone lactonase YvrE
MRRIKFSISLALASALLVATTAVAAPAAVFPKIIPLPDGFRPEGIARGYGTDFYVGSLANGAIYKGDLRTGEGAVFVPGQPGRVAVGLEFDKRSGYLFVAGGPTGAGHVYDTRTGEQVGEFQFSGPGSFINDVVVTRSAAYFTDSFNPVLYVVPLSPQGGLPDASAVETLPLSGDWTQVAGFNANGIEAIPSGQALIVVNSALGNLYRVDPATGAATLIDLGGATVTSGDGLLLDARRLYVVRNVLNQIAVIDLARDLSSGEVVDTITDPAFRIPTTITEFGFWLYAVNARFDVQNPTPDTEYEVVQVPKH